MNHPSTRPLRAVLFALTLLACSLTTPEAAAQAMRPAETFFLRPQVGVASYVGDRDAAFFSSGDGFPYAVGLELGYQFEGPVSLGVGYLLGNYRGIGSGTEAATRHTVDLLLRYTFGGTTGLAPYVHAGAHATFGDVDVAATATESRTAFGPLVGVGLDVPLSNRVSFFVEGTTRAAFGDDAADGVEDAGFGSFDLLSNIGAGLKINFRSAAVAPDVLSLDGPRRLVAGETGTFTARVDERATAPVEYRWAFGDGTTATGLTATHRYATPGTYTVQFTATNRAGTDGETMTVTVERPVLPARIRSVMAEPSTPETGVPVRFSATVEGDAPLTYSWDFGDGATATGAAPTHTYRTAGPYTVTLTVQNAAGTDTETLALTVRPPSACDEVAEMNAVFFDRNTSMLTSEARASLDENVEILLECPGLNVRLEGWASPGERSPLELSQDRARAVAEYYRQQGIAADRMATVGNGRPTGTTSKKDGAHLYQRVDTIPVH